MKLNKIHHVAVICSDYERSKRFYVDVLGLKIVSEHYRKERDSWEAQTAGSAKRMLWSCSLFRILQRVLPVRKPPVCAILRFEVDDVAAAVGEVEGKGVACEPIRTDEYTGKRFVFFSDPDGLPIELYEK